VFLNPKEPKTAPPTAPPTNLNASRLETELAIIREMSSINAPICPPF
jgi:hypothetical protein